MQITQTQFPPQPFRKTSLILHTPERDEVMREIIQTQRPKAIKFMGDAGTLERYAQWMHPDQIPHLRTYAIQSERGYFHSNDRPSGDARAAAQAAVDALSPQWEVLQSSSAPVKTFLTELWNERGNDEYFFTVHRHAAEITRSRFPRLTLAVPNTAVGNYNDEQVWREYVNSGLADQPNVICAMHGYAWAALWTAHLFGWQHDEAKTRWLSTPYEALPFDQFITLDTGIPASWTAWGILRAKSFLIQMGKPMVRFGLSEYLFDDVYQNARPLGFGGVNKQIREGLYNHWITPNRDVYDIVADMMVWGEKQMVLWGDWLEFAEVFVYNDVEDRFWATDYGIKGAIYNKFKHLINQAIPLIGSTPPPPQPDFPDMDAVYVRTLNPSGQVNIRRFPRTNENNVIETLLSSEVERVDGWYAAPDGFKWLWVRTPATVNNGHGWVRQDVIRTNKPFESLPMVEPYNLPNPQEEALRRALEQINQLQTQLGKQREFMVAARDALIDGLEV